MKCKIITFFILLSEIFCSLLQEYLEAKQSSDLVALKTVYRKKQNQCGICCLNSVGIKIVRQYLKVKFKFHVCLLHSLRINTLGKYMSVPRTIYGTYSKINRPLESQAGASLGERQIWIQNSGKVTGNISNIFWKYIKKKTMWRAIILYFLKSHDKILQTSLSCDFLVIFRHQVHTKHS